MKTSTKTAICISIILILNGRTQGQIIQNDPAYQQMVEQMQIFKPKDFQPPPTDSPFIATWHMNDGPSGFRIILHSDGVGVMSLANDRTPFFWENAGNRLQITWTTQSDEQYFRNLIIEYNPKADILLYMHDGNSNKFHKLCRLGKIYAPYSDRKIYLPAPNEEMVSYKPLTVDANGKYVLSGIVMHPELAFALISLLKLDTKEAIHNHVDAYRALLDLDISPAHGWSPPQQLVTRSDLASVTLSVIGNPDNIDFRSPHDCINNLKSRGCQLNSVDDSLEFIKKYVQQGAAPYAPQGRAGEH